MIFGSYFDSKNKCVHYTTINQHCAPESHSPSTMFLRACTASCIPLTACRSPSWLRHFGHGAGAGLVANQVATHVWHPISELQHVANIGCTIGPGVNHCGLQLCV